MLKQLLSTVVNELNEVTFSPSNFLLLLTLSDSCDSSGHCFQKNVPKSCV